MTGEVFDMKFLIMATVAVLALGGIYHQEIARSFSEIGDGARTGGSTAKSVRNLGAAMNNNMQGIGRALGQ